MSYIYFSIPFSVSLCWDLQVFMHIWETTYKNIPLRILQ